MTGSLRLPLPPLIKSHANPGEAPIPAICPKVMTTRSPEASRL